MNYRIRSLQTGTVTVDAGLSKTYAMMEAGQLVRYAQFIFYVESEDKSIKLLFEAGMPEASEGDKLMGCGEYGPFPPARVAGPKAWKKRWRISGSRLRIFKHWW